MPINGLTLNDSEWMKDIEEKWAKYQSVLFSLIDDDVDDNDHDTLSGEPYCGCETCEVREAIVFFSPYIIRGYKDGKIELED